MEAPCRVAVLGCTGSIGRQALDVIARSGGRFEAVALAGGSNTRLLTEQVVEFRPRYAWASASDDALGEAVAAVGAVLESPEAIASAPDVDIVLVATAGAAGLLPTLAALRAGKAVAIANKEVLVMAGHLVGAAMVEGGGELRPVDSEHSAIWQCLWGESPRSIRRIILTASGGAFRDFTREQLASVTPEQALDHPTWKMGRKITVDSATLMNKGMETIEAMWLFDVPMSAVEVVLHRESIVHSLVEFSDGSVKAQLGVPDMRLPIQLALSYPARLPEPPMPLLDLAGIGALHFAKPDTDRFPCLRIAMEAGRAGGTLPAAMAAADEVAVERFLAGEIGFLDIPRVIERVLERHRSIPDPTLDEVLNADAEARRLAAAVPPGVLA
ncbi:1-deoxy-D-xylulose-5-phosphate reductoisomerase [Tepidiforma sp.]|uniref:1-deoxy-D-xylulose-5-phosphate reductoisomerase n=1 Tax=Tepidiforma sp. TaxID=2682230 RepID=UPI002ADE45BE|nr:1-deoxy-D-xylulose-5-phosphate reductoisomerase [Tepidiforma sp.]